MSDQLALEVCGCGRQNACRLCKRAYNAAYYRRNRERLTAEVRAKRRADRESYNASMRAYRKVWTPTEHSLRVMLDGGERYRQRNLSKFADKERTRRARKRANGGSYSTADWRRLVNRFAGCCAYCGERRPLTADHVVPVTRGGTGFIGNILPACISCNASKHNRLLVEWRRR